ncbi:MAG: carboxypeptidase-like regulatory domain-containing protein [Bacteroidaceae bacterium]|nr:carboxypeptidase-like regulatory domain-containing protein [Bacteroidaceae bacterium]
MKRTITFLLSALSALYLQAQTKHTVSGYITDKSSKETLIGATILDKNSARGAITNEYGFYSLTLPDGAVELSTGYVGYKPVTLSFNLRRDTVINIDVPVIDELTEVTIYGNREMLGVKGSQMSAVDIPIEQIKAVPAMFGETDVLKALQLLPGVMAGAEATAGLYVRGGNPDENLLLLDGVPVYNVNHMFGMFSVFNPDAIKNVTLYKGSFPAHYYGRLSSVVDIRMKDGDMENYHGNVSIGLISSKFNFEGPIIKGKTSFNLSARRTYSDLLLNAALWLNKQFNYANAEDMNMGYYFYDLNLKVNHKFNDTDRLYLSWYSGDDDIYFKYRGSGGTVVNKTKLDWRWGNTVAAIRWNHVINPRLFMDISANYTQYRHKMGIDIKENDRVEKKENHAGVKMKSGIYDMSVRSDLHWSPSVRQDIRVGASYTHHRFKPDVRNINLDSNNPNDSVPSQNSHFELGSSDIIAHEIQLYAEDDIELTDVIKANIGAGWAAFKVNGKFYSSIEPRLSSRFLVTDNLSFKAGYAYMTQYVHLLSNNTINLPTDLWVPVTDKITPEHSHQWAAGASYSLDGIADFTLEGYYKHMNNLLEYQEGSTYVSGDTDWQDKIAIGKGWSYGIEFMAQRSIGKLNGWISYTWSHSQRRFDRPGMMINGGRTYDAKYDRRHSLDITCNYKFSEKFDMSATWLYETGNCGTLYTQYYNSEPFGIEEDRDMGSLGYYENRNNLRLRPTHRLDLGFNWHRKMGKRCKRTINLSVYNAYNNRNPFLVYVYTDSYYKEGHYYEDRKLKQLTLFPILPSFSYAISF